MVVGEISSNVMFQPQSVCHGYNDEREQEHDRGRLSKEEKSRRLGREIDRNENRRKKTNRGRQRNESVKFSIFD